MASNPAVTEKGDERDDNDGNGTDELVVARPATMEPIPVVSVPGLDVARRRDMMHSPHGTPERFPPFPRNAELKGSPMSERHLSEPMSELQDLLNHSKDKAGLCIICSCANPQQGKRILECTAPQKMTKCFGNDLGFSIREYSDLSIERMRKLLDDVGSLKIPQFCVKDFRFFFYFFGHGNEKEICLTDGNFQRHEIVSKVQKFDEDQSLCKVLLIDSCRHKTQQLASATQENTNLEHSEIHGEPVKASETERGKSVMALGDDSEWEEREAYPESINTLVIYSTFRSSEALYVTDRYHDMRGCGVMTYFFTQLASTLNQPLSVVLTKVREKVAIFIKEVESSLSPQVLVFDHFLMESVNLLAESKGAERVKPEIVGVHTTTNITTVQWEFQLEDQEKVKLFTLSCRDVQRRPVDIEEVPSAMKNVRDFKNAFLVPDKVYMITVLAVYEDGFKSESEAYQFTSISRGCPNEITITPVLSDRTKATLWWKFSGDDKDISKFLVEVDNKEGTTVDPCYREANIKELKPYVSHAVRVIAVFKDEYRTESKIISYTIPTEDQMKPVITCDESKHSTFLVTVSCPPVIQQFPNDNNIQLERVKVWRVPCGVDSEDKSFERCEISNKNELNEPTQTVKLAGSIPGKDYSIICKMKYTTGDVLKNETLFSSAKPQCCQRIFYSPKFIIVSFFAMILLSFLFSVSYIPYSIYLKGSTDVQTHYASTNTAIDCGTGNSRTHNGISLKGSLQRGDTLDSVINAWLVRRDKLKLYSQKAGPYIDGYRPLPGDHTVQLSGWNVYLWVRSIISGYCCVQNENGTERTASIFLFTSFDDALNFRSGGRAENYILTETLTIPQDSARCFTVFGPDKPLTVNESSYHIFVVQFSADNMNFSSEINYVQNYVNTSDYSHPHQFQYDSQTHLQFPTGPEHPTDYIAICKAVTLKTAHPEAESIHIQSWGSQYWWDTLYIVAVSITLFMCIYTAIACLCFCMLQYFREKCLYFLNGCHTIVFHIFHCPRCISSFQFCHCPRCDYERIN